MLPFHLNVCFTVKVLNTIDLTCKYEQKFIMKTVAVTFNTFSVEGKFDKKKIRRDCQTKPESITIQMKANHVFWLAMKIVHFLEMFLFKIKHGNYRVKSFLNIKHVNRKNRTKWTAFWVVDQFISKHHTSLCCCCFFREAHGIVSPAYFLRFCATHFGEMQPTSEKDELARNKETQLYTTRMISPKK